jgi:hypothetical protein
MRHPLSGAVYELCDDGVRVTLGDHVGVYDACGRWLSGKRMPVCPNLCAWIGDGPRNPVDVSTNRRFRNLPDRAEATS